MMLPPTLRARLHALTGELAKDAGAARIATIELHYAIERLQQATEQDDWPQNAHELCDMALTINTTIVEIIQALFSVAAKAQRMAAIADLAAPSGGNSV